MEENIRHLLKAGTISIEGVHVECGVLDDATRIVSSNISCALTNGYVDIADFFSLPYLQPFISARLRELCKAPITYIDLNGITETCYKTEILPEMCFMWISAAKAGVLTPEEQRIAARCNVIINDLVRKGVQILEKDRAHFN